MQPLFLPIAIISGIAAAAAIGWLIFDEVLRERWLTGQRLADRFRVNGEETRKRSPLFRDLKILHDQTRQEQLSPREKFALALEQSGLGLPVERVFLIAGLVGLMGGITAYFACPYPLMTIPATLITFVIPFVYVEYKRRTRIQSLCRQLPEAFDQLKRAVKSGQTIAGAMQIVATDMPAPLSEEFSICCKQQQLGLSVQAALHDLARRTGVMELQIFSVAMLVQRDSGGNCIELLNNLAEMVRGRLNLVARVKALTGEGRMQATVLAVLPIAAFAAIMTLDPEYAKPLLERPQLLIAIATAQIVGMLWIRTIVNVEY
jgi:tight adherence protein B